MKDKLCLLLGIQITGEIESNQCVLLGDYYIATNKCKAYNKQTFKSNFSASIKSQELQPCI